MATLSRIFVWLLLQSLCVSSWSFLSPVQLPSHSHSTTTTTTTTTTHPNRPRDTHFQLSFAASEESSTGMSACDESTKAAFQGKRVLLTGASGGLGAALALELAECRAETIVLSGRNKESLDAIANKCQEIYPDIQTVVLTCDLASKESVAELGTKALDLCRGTTIDVLINNGGVSSRSNFLDTQLEIDEKVMQINFFSGASLAKALVPKMVEQKSGKIIWISSVQGLVGIPSRTSYAASKFAVQGYCESLRAELASSGVTVHVASPGYIRTNLSLSAVTGDGTSYGKMDETTANGADPKDVAVSVLNSVAASQADFIVAASFSAKLAIWLRLLWPSLLQRKLADRFVKSESEKKKNE